MIAALEEIRIARDATDLVMTLSTRHPGLQWAVEAIEFKHGEWRVVTVVHGSMGLMRFEDKFCAAIKPVKIFNRVNEILSMF